VVGVALSFLRKQESIVGVFIFHALPCPRVYARHGRAGKRFKASMQQWLR